MTEAEPKAAKEAAPQSKIKIESLNDLRRVLVVAEGGDPDAIQAITNFMNLKSNAERSYFPDKTITLAVGQLLGYGQLYFKGQEWDPCTLVADAISVPFMGYKGFKSNQFVDMTRQTPDLADFQTSANVEQAKSGLWNRITGRAKTE